MRSQEVYEFTNTRLLSARTFVWRNDEAGENFDGAVFGRGEVRGLVVRRAGRRDDALRVLMLLTERPASEARELAGSGGLSKHLQYRAAIRSLVGHRLKSFSSPPL